MTEATTALYLATFALFDRKVAKNRLAWTQSLRQTAIFHGRVEQRAIDGSSDGD